MDYWLWFLISCGFLAAFSVFALLLLLYKGSSRGQLPLEKEPKLEKRSNALVVQEVGHVQASGYDDASDKDSDLHGDFAPHWKCDKDQVSNGSCRGQGTDDVNGKRSPHLVMRADFTIEGYHIASPTGPLPQTPSTGSPNRGNG